MLICPICQHVLYREENSFKCIDRHCFDVAKSGYVNLWPGGHRDSGDDKAMVEARTHFLSQGHYESFQRMLLQTLMKLNPTTILDVGCGEGYYTSAIAHAFPEATIFALDVSKSALVHASKQNHKIQYMLASLANIPLSDHSIDVICDIFAPVDHHCFKRVLKHNGYLIKVGPGKQHLWEMKEILYPHVYENDDAIIEYDGFTHISREVVQEHITLSSPAEIKALFQMTPYYWKSPKDTSAQLLALTTLSLQVVFCFDVYQAVVEDGR